MQKFKKNRILIIGVISFILVSGFSFYLKPKEEKKLQERNRELIVMYIQNDSGEYTTSEAKTFPKEGYVLNLKKSACKNGSVLSQDSLTKKINLKVQSNDQCTLYFDKEIPSLKEFYDNVTKKSTVPNFANPATTDETADGLFSMQDDYGMSYYFRGTAPDNYIKFGQNARGQDMWWRIIRFNGDGTVRMQYDGAGTSGMNSYTRGFAMTGQPWNSTYNDAKYVGWMFGGANGSASTSREQAQRNETDSPIKTKVDEWYKTNIVDTGYGNYVADNIFCNDRSTPGKSATGLSGDTGLGYGSNVTAYGSTARTNVWNTDESKVQPRFTCPQENDKYTVEETSGGNGALTYPVGLITADEIVAAGSGKYGTTNNSYYLNKGSWYWSFSPSSFGGSYAYVFRESSYLNSNSVHNSGAIAPVINLKVEYIEKFKGNGTIDSPYRLII